MGIFSSDKIMTADKVRKELSRLLLLKQAQKKLIASIDDQIKEVQSKCPHELTNVYDPDPRFLPKNICQDCGAEV